MKLYVQLLYIFIFFIFLLVTSSQYSDLPVVLQEHQFRPVFELVMI